MGLLSDIYISQDADASAYDVSPENFPLRVEYKGITPLELTTLWAIIRGIPWDVAMMDELPCILQEEGGERLIHRFPNGFVTNLADLTPEQLGEISSKWAATDELQCEAEDVRDVIENLMKMARQTLARGEALFLWNCV